MEEASPLQKIQLQLQELRCDAAGQQRRKFIPEGSLQNTLQLDTVINVLKNPNFSISLHKVGAAASFVVEHALKIFAILVDLNLESKLVEFIRHDVTDLNLPISKDTLEEFLNGSASSFEELQWEYIAYQIRKGRKYQTKIPKSRILPYTKQEVIGTGSFSTVYKVEIHPAHHDLIPQVHDKVHRDVFK